jgi:hypothetical protein
VIASLDGTTPPAMGHNPRLILGRPVPPYELVRGMQGRTRNLAMWSREGDGAPSGLGVHGVKT